MPVFKIFVDEYKNKNDKSLFFKDRKYQRLREGYWGLFVCKALDKMENKKHFLSFPSDPSNDINFLSVLDKNSDKMNKLVFDIKELTNYSGNFKDFVEKKVNTKRSIYGIIIAILKDIEGKEWMNNLYTDIETDRGVFVVSALSRENCNIYRGRVDYF